MSKKNNVETDGVEPLVMPRFDYDEEADVMYISFGKPVACKSIEMNNGIVTRYTPPDNRLKGMTIIDFKKRVLDGVDEIWQQEYVQTKRSRL